MISFKQSCLILASLLLLFFLCLMVIHVSPTIAISSAIVLMYLFALIFHYPIRPLVKEMFLGLKLGVKPIIILLIVGGLIGLFISSGFIPYCLYWGLVFFTPKYFLVSSLMLCILISSLTGSSITTGGTIGVAMMGIGSYLGVDPRYTAGSVICGAFFGDKMSPLSDTTNFAPGLVGIDITTHIKCMMGTTIPSLIISLVFFQFLPISYASLNLESISSMQKFLNEYFSLGPIVLIIPIVLIGLSFFKLSTYLHFGIVFFVATILSLYVNPELSIYELGTIVMRGFSCTQGPSEINRLLSRGGILSMIDSIQLIILALCLGGLLHNFQIISTILKRVHQLKLRKGPLIAICSGFCLIINIITGEQYLSILVPGLGLRDIFEDLQIPKKYLSRALEDAGTLINPLIPWSICGVFFTKALGVPVIDYLPYCVFIYSCFFLTIILGFIQK